MGLLNNDNSCSPEFVASITHGRCVWKFLETLVWRSAHSKHQDKACQGSSASIHSRCPLGSLAIRMASRVNPSAHAMRSSKAILSLPKQLAPWIANHFLSSSLLMGPM